MSLRFLLGVAEAGFFPGIIVYFTHWFASGDRARALSGLIMAVPFSLALGAPVSALLLDVHWLGLAGWKWLFIVEGLPAVVLGSRSTLLVHDRPPARCEMADTPKNATTLKACWPPKRGRKKRRARQRIRDALRCRMSGCSRSAFSPRTPAAMRSVLAADDGEKSFRRLRSGDPAITAVCSIPAAW